MFLAILLGSPFKNELAILKSRICVAKHKFLWRNDQVTFCCGDTRIGNRVKLVYLGNNFLRRFSGKFFACRQNYSDRHSLKMNFAVSQQRLVRHDTADLVFPDNIFRSDDLENTF